MTHFHNSFANNVLPQHPLQKFDVLDRELEDLGLAQLLVQWMRWKQPTQLGERAAHVLLAEPFPYQMDCFQNYVKENSFITSPTYGCLHSF